MENTINTDSQFLITTIDNPFNPFTQPDEWRKFDQDYGYNTYEMIARYGKFDNNMTEEEENEEYEFVMNKILRIHPMYIKVRNADGLDEKLRKLRENLIEEAKKSF